MGVWRREDVIVAKQQSVAPPTAFWKEERYVRGRRSREPPTIRIFYNLFPYENKKHTRKGVFFVGAEKRIRTSGRVPPVTRFPIVLLKPLRHLCINSTLSQAPIYITVFFRKMQAFFARFSKNL